MANGGSDDSTYSFTDFGIDPDIEELRAPSDAISAEETAIIRTSDRIAFKRCRRRWGWNSAMKQNLGPKETQNPLWFGTGMHFALEDFHGYNRYGSPAAAFEAYCTATHALRRLTPLPAIFDELRELGIGMMKYYAEDWLEGRDPLRTLWVDGKPQVEVRVLLEVPFDVRQHFPDSPYRRVMYSLTIDRVCEDDEGRLFLLDYKSAKQFSTTHYSIDPQIGAYYWAGGHVYPGRPISGFIYQQHRKSLPDPPRITAAGRLSTDARQLTTHRAYRKALVNIFGPSVDKWPVQNLDMLNNLALSETSDGDRFVRRDKIYRNEYSFESEGHKILLELEDMLNPNLPLYPNPTRDCAGMCPFMHACTSMDDGGDFTYELQLAHRTREKENENWRIYLPPPPAPQTPTQG